ncbi:MAG: LptF/LptG family permease [Treponema sp.]|jgi:lipopolysaccharide export system permease protein|nr:LptF/LptG family permease [Treponema sp.]
MILDRYLIRHFIPIFFVASAMFVLIIILMDLFANLWRYLNYEVAIIEILKVSFYYLPKSFSYALPLSLLFSAAYTLGDLYGRNELTAIFSSGIPFSRFSLPLLIIGIIASVFSFFFDDYVVIPTLKTKNDLSRTLLHQPVSEDNSDVVIRAQDGTTIYAVDYYDNLKYVLNRLIIIERGEDSINMIVRAPQAVWNGSYWELSNAVLYRWNDGIFQIEALPFTDKYREEPETFRRSSINVEEVSSAEAALLVRDLRTAGLPFNTALADYYHRFSFPSASFVVIILSISMGGRFRKNILLMTLLSSLFSAVVFYVMEMISMMMAKLSYIPPLVGAWFPIISFVVIGFVLLRSAKT